MRGLLVAFEGIDGAGKTTQALLLENALRARGLSVVRTKEPTQGPWGEKIRRSLGSGRLPLAEELEAFTEDRRAHVEQIIEPALVAGSFVICDRYFLSSCAYQGANGIPPETILQQNEALAPIPQRIFLLDIPADEGLRRIAARGTGINVFEKRATLDVAGEIFRSVNRLYVDRIDGMLPATEIHRIVIGTTDGILWTREHGPDIVKNANEIAHDPCLTDENRIKGIKNLFPR